MNNPEFSFYFPELQAIKTVDTLDDKTRVCFPPYKYTEGSDWEHWAFEGADKNIVVLVGICLLFHFVAVQINKSAAMTPR